MNASVFVGIDVAKRHLDVHILPKDLASRYTNSGVGIGALVKMLRKEQPKLVVLEATGKLELPAAAALFAAGIPVAIVNPRQVRDFARASGKLAKTDALDARVIATYGSALHPDVRPIPDAISLQLGRAFGSPAAAGRHAGGRKEPLGPRASGRAQRRARAHRVASAAAQTSRSRAAPSH